MLCSLIARCVDANRKSCGLLLFFSLGSTVGGGGGRQASRQQRFCCFGVAGTGSAVVDHLCERRRRGGGTAPISRTPGRHMCNWRRRGPVAPAVDYSRFFFLGNNHDDTQCLPCANKRRRVSELCHAQAALLAVSDEIMDRQRPGCQYQCPVPVPVPVPVVSTGISPARLTMIILQAGSGTAAAVSVRG